MTTYLGPIVMDQARASNRELIRRLESIPLGRMYQASFRAAVRLHLLFTGWTHEHFGEFNDKARAILLKYADSEGALDGTAGFQAQGALLKAWSKTYEEWTRMFEKARVEAGSIPFGVMAVTHERLVLPAVSGQRVAVSERVEDGVFSPQLSVLLNAASEHLYGNALNLSARIWRIDTEAQNGMRELILRAISNGDSAWNLAKELEQFLGANQDCPRWTSTRLYGMTKTQIAQGDTRGLVSNPCDGRGVAYNALRLARTEIQKIHALATDRIMQAQPWVKKEQVNLSASHPEEDICDEVVAGGEGGKGIYDVGEIELPLHPNCLCYKTAVLMDEKDFTSRLNGWLKGETWEGMDRYAELISGYKSQDPSEALGASILPSAIHLAVWLFGDKLEEWLR